MQSSSNDKSVYLSVPFVANEAIELQERTAAETETQPTWLPPRLARFKPQYAVSDAAVLAVQAVCSAHGLAHTECDALISATLTPDYNNPGLVSCILAKLDWSGVPGLELKQGACGGHYAVQVARSLILSGRMERVLIVCAEGLSRFFGPDVLDPTFLERLAPSAREAALRFADGAVALLVSSSPLTGSSVSFRLKDLELYSNADLSSAGTEWLRCELPSANRFPIRMTEEDVAQGRHYPEWDFNRYVEAASEALSLMLSKAFTDKECALPQNWIVHFCSRELRERFAEHLNLSGMVLEDCAEQLGYVGAAGVFTQLSHFAATIDLGSNAELGLVTLSPGMTCSLMRLSVVKGDGS